MFDEVYSRSISDPEAFWGEAANDVYWFKKPERVLDRTAGVYGRWFPRGITNTCYNTNEPARVACRGAITAIDFAA